METILPRKTSNINVEAFILGLINTRKIDPQTFTKTSRDRINNLQARIIDHENDYIQLSEFDKNEIIRISHQKLLANEHYITKIKKEYKLFASDAANVLGYTLAALKSKKKTDELSFVRYVIWMFSLNNMYYSPFSKSAFMDIISNIFMRNRTTIIHGIKIFSESNYLQEQYDYLESHYDKLNANFINFKKL